MAQEIGTKGLMETWASGGTVTAPSVAKVDAGWQFEEQPPHEYMNWVHNSIQKKVNYLMRSGIPEWDTATPYQIGDVVQWDGFIWTAVAANTGSTPAEANTNWNSNLLDDRYYRKDEWSIAVGTSGYQTLPSGLIIQWSNVTTSAGTASVTFPIAFPSAVFSVVGVHTGTGGAMFVVNSRTTTGFTAIITQELGAISNTNYTGAWIALGV